MARTQSSGSGAASAWAVVIFAAGFVICLILAIVFYVQLNGARAQYRQLEQEMDHYVASSQRASPVISELRSGQGTVVGTLLDRNRQLKAMIASQGASFKELQRKKQSLNVRQPLMMKVENMQADLNARQQQIQQLQADIEQARRNLSNARKQTGQVRGEYEKRYKQLQGRMGDVQSQLKTYRQQLTQMQGDLSSQMKQARQKNQQTVAKRERTIRGLKEKVSQLQQNLQETREQASRLTPENTLRPDGRITSLASNGQRVTLNLGRDDQLVRGMTFEVFSSDQVVRPEEAERGKATIEVVNISPGRATARVVRRSTNAASIRKGDQLINVAYDPDTTFKFYVYGQFNIRGQESGNADGRMVRNIIRQWGGRVVDQLSYDTDFLVLGQRPSVPEALPSDVNDPAQIRARSQAKQVYQQYQDLLEKAQTLGIPVLNQNRFMSLVGFYQR